VLRDVLITSSHMAEEIKTKRIVLQESIKMMIDQQNLSRMKMN
jgi:predicted regulator of amino acid metabolism with ACT domain